MELRAFGGRGSVRGRNVGLMREATPPFLLAAKSDLAIILLF